MLNEGVNASEACHEAFDRTSDRVYSDLVKYIKDRLPGRAAVGPLTPAAASSPKQVNWYECGHKFNDAQSAMDREN